MTTKTAHTPGPWRVIIQDDGAPLTGRPSVVASDELDCGIVHWDGFIQTYWRSARGDREIRANAQLIAAAPDLLAVVLDAGQADSPNEDVRTTWWERRAAAVAKATA